MSDRTAGNAGSVRSDAASTGTPYTIQRDAMATDSGSPVVHPVVGARVLEKNITASIVADLIIDFCNDHGDVISNLRLPGIQKVLFRVSGRHKHLA